MVSAATEATTAATTTAAERPGCGRHTVAAAGTVAAVARGSNGCRFRIGRSAAAATAYAAIAATTTTIASPTAETAEPLLSADAVDPGRTIVAVPFDAQVAESTLQRLYYTQATLNRTFVRCTLFATHRFLTLYHV